jgi:methylmalonyl-CoA/ethylmalonyl-CoA epimerase
MGMICTSNRSTIREPTLELMKSGTGDCHISFSWRFAVQHTTETLNTGQGDGVPMRRIDHIGIAVSDLVSAMVPYVEGLGIQVEHEEEVPSQMVRVVMLPVGETNIELLEPTSEDSPIAKFLDRKGPGIHHIAFAVEDIEIALERMANAGVRMIDEEPRPGAGGTRVAFAHPKAFNGVLIELVEGGHR